jgi:hypothetical protein
MASVAALLAAAVFAHGMAEFRDDGLAVFGEHEVDGARRTGCKRREPGSVWLGALGGLTGPVTLSNESGRGIGWVRVSRE